MKNFNVVEVDSHEIMLNLKSARQIAALFRFSDDGQCFGIYKSPESVLEGQDNWSITQGGIRHSDCMMVWHPSIVASQRELQEELARQQSYDDFEYHGSVIGCDSRVKEGRPLNRADYHLVSCFTGHTDVRLNRAEVAEFRWQNVLGCIRSIEAGGLMSPQKSGIVLAGLRKIAGKVEDNVNHPVLVKHLRRTDWVDYLNDKYSVDSVAA